MRSSQAKRATLRLELRGHLADQRLVRLLTENGTGYRESLTDVGKQATRGAVHRGGGRKQRRSATEPFHQLRCGYPRRAAGGHEPGAAWIDSLLHAHFNDCGRALFEKHLKHGFGRVLDTDAQWLRHSPGDCVFGECPALLVGDSGKAAQVLKPENHRGIGERRIVAAPAVARRTGEGPRALRPDPQQPALFQPGDAPSTGSDASNVHRGEPGHVTEIGLTDPGLLGAGRAALAQKG